MFNWLVHSNTRLRMMKLFFKDPSAPLYGLEIAQSLKASPGTTHRELNSMLKQGIITKKKEKGLVLYYLNQKHPYFSELKKAVFPKKKTQRVLFIGDLHLNAETPADIIEDLHLFCDYAEDNATELVLLGDVVEMLTGDVFQTYLLHKPLFDRLNQLSHDIKITYVVGNHDCFLESLCHEGAAGQFFGSSIRFAKEYTNPKLGIFAQHGHICDDFSVLKSNKAKRAAQSNAAELQMKLKKSKLPGDFSPHLTQLGEISSYADQALKYSEYVKQKKLDSTPMLVDAAKELILQHDYAYVVFGHSHKSALKALNNGLYLNPGSWKSEKKHHFVEIDNEGGALVSVSELM